MYERLRMSVCIVCVYVCTFRSIHNEETVKTVRVNQSLEKSPSTIGP